MNADRRTATPVRRVLRAILVVCAVPLIVLGTLIQALAIGTLALADRVAARRRRGRSSRPAAARATFTIP